MLPINRKKIGTLFFLEKTQKFFLFEIGTLFPEIIGNIFSNKKSKTFSRKKDQNLFSEKRELFQIKYHNFFLEKRPDTFFYEKTT
jgi:hypothetical protein